MASSPPISEGFHAPTQSSWAAASRLNQPQAMRMSSPAQAMRMSSPAQAMRMSSPAKTMRMSSPAQTMRMSSSAQAMRTSSPAQVHNFALQDYQMQLMLLEQQNKKRLCAARGEKPPPPLAQSPESTSTGTPVNWLALQDYEQQMALLEQENKKRLLQCQESSRASNSTELNGIGKSTYPVPNENNFPEPQSPKPQKRGRIQNGPQEQEELTHKDTQELNYPREPIETRSESENQRSPHDMNALPSSGLLKRRAAEAKLYDDNTNQDFYQTVQKQQPTPASFTGKRSMRIMKQRNEARRPTEHVTSHFAPASFEYNEQPPPQPPASTPPRQPTDTTGASSSRAENTTSHPPHFAPASFEYKGTSPPILTTWKMAAVSINQDDGQSQFQQQEGDNGHAMMDAFRSDDPEVVEQLKELSSFERRLHKRGNLRVLSPQSVNLPESAGGCSASITCSGMPSRVPPPCLAWRQPTPIPGDDSGDNRADIHVHEDVSLAIRLHI